MFLTIFTWWVWLELLGLVALPFAFLLFKNLPDRGYPLSKTLGVLFLSYLLWLGSSLHVIANRRWSIVLILLVLCIVAALLARRQWNEIKAYFAKNIGLIAVVELIFAAGLVLWSVIRAYDPAILLPERPVNFLFINAIMRSSYMPPPDPWLAGFPLNYYYFGHFMVATLTKLTGLPASVTFNLAMGSIFASASLGIFSLGFNLARGDGEKAAGFKRAVFAGLAGIVFLLFVSNLEGFLEFMYAHNVGSADFWKWIGIKGLTAPYSSLHWYPTEPEWWFRSVRVIDTLTPAGASLDLTFNDFPLYNLMAGYIHAHLMAMPVALVALSFGLDFLRSDRPWGWDSFKNRWYLPAAMSVTLGALGVTNSWDLASYGLFLICVFFIHGFFHRREEGWMATIILSCSTLLGAFVFFVPYYNTYQPYSGFLPWLGPGTRNVHWFLILGLFASVFVPFVVVASKPDWNRSFWKPLCLALIPLAAPFALWMIASGKTGVTAVTPSPAEKLYDMLPLVLVLLFTLALLLSRIMGGREQGRGSTTGIYVLLCLFTALYIVYGTDLFWFRDAVMGGRANTIFKFYYHVWVLLAVVSAYGIYYLLFVWRPLAAWTLVSKVLCLSVFGLLLASSLAYGPAAVLTKTGFFQGTPTMDGLDFLPAQERQVIDWLNDSVPGAPVTIEASNIWSLEESRFAVRTGLPTLMGPTGAEKSWRGDMDKEFMSRIKDLEVIYQSDDLFKVQSLLTKYQAEYIIVGGLENYRYGAGIKERFDGWFERVFSNGGTTIYRAFPSTLMPARNPRAAIVEIFYRDPGSADFLPLPASGELPQDTYHFAIKMKNTGQEKVTLFLDVTQSDGIRLGPWGAPEWDLGPGGEVGLFMQGSSFKPAGRTVQMTFTLKEKGSNRALDTKSFSFRSK